MSRRAGGKNIGQKDGNQYGQMHVTPVAYPSIVSSGNVPPFRPMNQMLKAMSSMDLPSFDSLRRSMLNSMMRWDATVALQIRSHGYTLPTMSDIPADK